MGRRLLVLPHVGTALGHLIRVGDILQLIGNDWDEIFVSVPIGAGPHAERFLPQKAELIEHRTRFTVTGPTGQIDDRMFLDSVLANAEIVASLSPDFILGDPGVHAGILGERFGIPWGHVVHAPYLPLPERLWKSDHVSLATRAWSAINAALDRLVSIGSDGRFSNWQNLRYRARETICVAPSGGFTRNDVPIPLGGGADRKGWKIGEPLPCLITVSSGDSGTLPRKLTDYLAERYRLVGVVGPCAPYPNPRVKYLGTSFDLRSLVSLETCVVTHGGSGTLQHLAGAGQITIVPGDLDQLCNGLLAHVDGRASIAGLGSWENRLAGGAPFIRDVPWDEYLNQLSLEGRMKQSQL